MLEGLDLQLSCGGFLAIVGPNGAGKSTLLKTMLGLLPLRAGAMCWPGGRPRIGYVPQKEQIDPVWPLRVRDLLHHTHGAMGRLRFLSRREDVRVGEVMETTGIGHLADQVLSTLSGGEMQRLLLARALVVNPGVLFLDEPTAAMDLLAAERFMNMISRLHQEHELPVVMVTHDLPATAGRAETLGILSHGKLHHGPVAEMLTAARLREVYDHPICVRRHEGRIHIHPEVLETEVGA